MKKSSRILALLLAGVMVLSLAACGGDKKDDAAASEIAMITDKGDINDKSFNQGTWEGIQA